MAFHVGQRVVCVDASWTNTLDLQELVEGETYTVVGLRLGPESGTPCVDVEGPVIPRPEWMPTRVYPYRSTRFRPVRTTSIDCFTALLHPAPKRRSTKRESVG